VSAYKRPRALRAFGVMRCQGVRSSDALSAYVYALTDYREVDRTIALASASSLS
jgi:hypothetical protein